MSVSECRRAAVAQLPEGQEAARSVEAVLTLAALALNHLSEQMIYGSPITPEMGRLTGDLARAINDALAPIATAREILTNATDFIDGAKP